MIISPITYGMPGGLVTPVTPAMAWQSTGVWHDDLNPDVAITSGTSDSGTADGIGGQRYQITAPDYYAQGQRFAVDTPLQTTVTASPDANRMVVETEADAFMALEMGGEFEGVLTKYMMQVDPPWSIPRYVQAGSTLDCDTSTPITGASVFIHDQNSGVIIATGTSDGVAAFSVPVFEPGPHLVRAVSGVRTAISLPVIATGA